MKCVDIWAQLKATPMLNDFIIGLECLIGVALLQPIVSLVKTTNRSPSTEMKFLLRNGKMISYFSYGAP